jgi:hypothetical protein
MSRSTYRTLLVTTTALVMALGVACRGGERTSGNADAGYTDVPPPTPSGARVEITLEPQKYVYPTGLPITPTAKVFNEQDEVVEEASVQWTVTPNDAYDSLPDNKYIPTSEGELTLKACQTQEGSATDLCGTKSIVIDSGNPDLQVSSPKAGAFIGTMGESKIQVEGEVSDTHGTTQVFVNSTKVQVEDDGTFSHGLEPEFGVNHIEIRANDGLHNTDNTVVRDVMYAPHYQSVDVGAGQVGFMTDGGISLQLGQNFFDDTEPPTTQGGSTIVTNDFADIAELLIQNIDLAGQIPNPAIDTSAVTLNIPDLQIGSPQVAIDITNQGLDLYLYAPNVTVTTGGGLTFEGQQLNLSGTVDAQLSGVVSMRLDKPSGSDPFEADISDLFVSLDRVESSFADPKADALFALAESALRSKLESLVVSEIESRFLQQIPTLVTDALNSINDAISQQSFTFDNSLIGKRTFTLNGSVGRFATSFRQAVRLSIDGTGQTSGEAIHPNAPGFPRLTDPGTAAPLFEQSRLQLGVDLGVLNGALYALWKAGFLKLDITDRLPDSVKGVAESGTLNAQLPPVLAPADDTSEYDLLLRLGQTEVEAKLLNQTDRVAANIKVGLDVTFDDSTLTLDIADSPTIDSWLIETTGEAPILTEELLRGAVKNEVWPRISSALEGGLEIDVPLPDLSAISNISPTLSDLKLDIVQARPLDVRRGFLMLDSKLEGRLELGN